MIKELYSDREEYIFFNEYKNQVDLVCVYNNQNCFDNVLIDSINRQKINWSVKLISYNNSNHEFSSMAKAYNHLLKFINNDIVIFLHQDIRFETDDALKNLVENASQLPKEQIWGIFGVQYPSRMTMKTDMNIVKVDSFDECLFGTSKNQICQMKFNEELCDNWHMYGVELCLRNNTSDSLPNFPPVIIPSKGCVHLSSGIINRNYIITLFSIINFYKQRGLKYIWTTCAKIHINSFYRLYIFIWYGKHLILNKIIRRFL